MSSPTFRPLAALTGAVILSLSLVGTAVAHEQEPASPAPSTAPAGTLDWHAEREALREERRAERQTQRTLRAAERAAGRDARHAVRERAKERRAFERDERQTQRDARRAAMAQVREACAAELAAARSDSSLDRSTWREAIRAARAACRDLYLAALESAGSGEAPIDALYTEAASDGTGVVRTDLGIAEPGSALGEELGLWHYYIPAQSELAPHTHPGWQLARVTAGELEYTVLEGEGILLRADGSQEPMGPGTYTLATGDGVIENPELVHQGANRTDEPVTIISATLFEAGEPVSTLADMTAADDPATDDPAAEDEATDQPAAEDEAPASE